jgi:hypothetical protein
MILSPQLLYGSNLCFLVNKKLHLIILPIKNTNEYRFSQTKHVNQANQTDTTQESVFIAILILVLVW